MHLILVAEPAFSRWFNSQSAIMDLSRFGLFEGVEGKQCPKCNRHDTLYWTTQPKNLAPMNYERTAARSGNPDVIPCIRLWVNQTKLLKIRKKC